MNSALRGAEMPDAKMRNAVMLVEQEISPRVGNLHQNSVRMSTNGTTTSAMPYLINRGKFT